MNSIRLIPSRVDALVSNHLESSEKWSQLELVAYENRKRPCAKTLTRAFNYIVEVTIQTGFHNAGRN